MMTQMTEEEAKAYYLRYGLPGPAMMVFEYEDKLAREQEEQIKAFGEITVRVTYNVHEAATLDIARAK